MSCFMYGMLVSLVIILFAKYGYLLLGWLRRKFGKND